MHGLNLKVSAGELSRNGTSSIEAHSHEEGAIVGSSATAAKISVLRCAEIQRDVDSSVWGAIFDLFVNV